MIYSNICYKQFFIKIKEIILIKKNITIMNQVIKANLEEHDCFKLHHL